MRGPIGTVMQRKGGASWREIGRLLYKVSRGGLESYEYQKTLRSDSEGKRITLSSAKDCARPVDFIRQQTQPEAAGSQMVINAAFVSLAYPENVRWGDTK